MIESLLRISQSRRGGWKSGTATVELAITAPVLVVLVLGIVDYGALMNNAASLEGATRAIAEFARNAPDCGDGLTTTCTTGNKQSCEYYCKRIIRPYPAPVLPPPPSAPALMVIPRLGPESQMVAPELG